MTAEMPAAGDAITHVFRWYDNDIAPHLGLFRGHVKADGIVRSTSQFLVDDEESRNMGALLNLWNEGVVWIRGRFEDSSSDAQALLAAYKLWASAA